jgi:hypothetical protein
VVGGFVRGRRGEGRRGEGTRGEERRGEERSGTAWRRAESDGRSGFAEERADLGVAHSAARDEVSKETRSGEARRGERHWERTRSGAQMRQLRGEGLGWGSKHPVLVRHWHEY